LKGRILVIDDEAEIRRNLSIGLMQEDYAVVACPDGISAIHELRQAKERDSGFDFLVTDIFMPDIDGLKILKVIKSLHPELPVLVMTGFGDEKSRRSMPFPPERPARRTRRRSGVKPGRRFASP
jgi:two-component system cell cycle response regulator CpdR